MIPVEATVATEVEFALRRMLAPVGTVMLNAPDPVETIVPESPELWRRKFLELLNDGQTRFTFNLDGVDVWAGMARAAKGSGGFTDWELLQLRMAKDSWKRITWMKDGVVVACPFE